jgi:hypothetical protein
VSKRIPLKDLLFNSAKVEQIAGEIAAAQPRFQAGRFVADVLGRFPELELKARIGWMAECLERNLPGGYRHGIEVILASLPPPNDPTRSDGDFGDFIYAPYADYVARRGCTAADATSPGTSPPANPPSYLRAHDLPRRHARRTAQFTGSQAEPPDPG